jgi:hypothetical protein
MLFDVLNKLALLVVVFTLLMNVLAAIVRMLSCGLLLLVPIDYANEILFPVATSLPSG